MQNADCLQPAENPAKREEVCMLKKIIAGMLSGLILMTGLMGLPSHRTAAAEPEEGSRPIRISCIGDSITYGQYCTDNNQETQSYPAQLQQLLGDGYQVSNFGVNGSTMLKNGSKPYVNQQSYQDSLVSEPDIVIIMLGTNDANGSNPPLLVNFEEDAMELIETYRDLPTHPEVFIATSATCYVNSIQPGIIRDQVVPMQKEIAEKAGCVLIDIHTATAGIGNLFPDNVHPNRQGYCLMAGVMCAALIRQETPSDAITELSSVYAEAQEINRAGQGLYSDASWADFQENLATAKNTFTRLDTLRDAVVTRIAAALDESMDNLSEEERPEYPAGLVLQYNFNDLKDGVVKDAAGRFDGMLMGNVTALDGFADGAVTLGGSREDYVSLPGDVFSMTDDVTISMWIKLDQNPDWTALLIGGDDTSNCFCLAASGTNLGLTYGTKYDGLSGARVSSSSADKVPAGEWAHMVYTQSGTEARLYLNGRQVGVNTEMERNPRELVGGRTVRIGANHLYNDPSMKGQLEDLSIYNGAMTADEVADLYAAWQDEDNRVTALEVPAEQTVAFGTDAADLHLPASIPAETAGGQTVDCPVYWETQDYDGQTPGEYVIAGRLTLPDGLRNPDGLACSVTVRVEASQEEVTVDTAELEAAIEAAEETLAGRYLPSSLEGLPAALEAAEALLADETAAQADVDAAADALYAEIEKAAPYLPGDMDGDGSILINDVMAACKVLARMNASEEPTADEIAVGNLDGKAGIGISDIMAICRMLAQQS